MKNMWEKKTHMKRKEKRGGETKKEITTLQKKRKGWKIQKKRKRYGRGKCLRYLEEDKGKNQESI